MRRVGSGVETGAPSRSSQALRVALVPRRREALSAVSRPRRARGAVGHAQRIVRAAAALRRRSRRTTRSRPRLVSGQPGCGACQCQSPGRNSSRRDATEAPRLDQQRAADAPPRGRSSVPQQPPTTPKVGSPAEATRESRQVVGIAVVELVARQLRGSSSTSFARIPRTRAAHGAPARGRARSAWDAHS